MGYSVAKQNIIALCPGVFLHERWELETVRGNDFRTVPLTNIEEMTSISSTLIHELLHIFFNNASKYTLS